MTKITEVTRYLEIIAPPAYQESYDNAGLITGDPETEVTGALVCLDSTEEVIDEAIGKNCNLVVAHHPIIFKGLKKITGRNYVERTIIKAIQNNIAIYAIHTNLDNVSSGVNRKICQKLELENVQVLSPKKGVLSKLVTFIPEKDTPRVLEALHEAGAGKIGAYDHCSFSTEGTGRFKPGAAASPHIGKPGEIESVIEIRVEVIFPITQWPAVQDALNESHPYEEVAYYLTSLDNTYKEVGSGMTGTLKTAMEPREFLKFLKEKMALSVIRHSRLLNKKISKIGVCGGSGSFLIQKAIAENTDIFVTGDLKYHEFFDNEGKIILADIGHYESEVYTKELLRDLLTKYFNTFAVDLSETVTNPVNYY